MNGAIVFKLATEPHEWEQIHELNYRTFVEEIPQHAANPERALRDRFDDENSYVVALQGMRLVGMICVRDRRPFSLDAKLPDLDEHLPPGRSVCEIRLLSVDSEHRNGKVFRGLVEELARVCLARGHDLAIISGTVRQLRLYRHIGFVPFGSLVGTPDALYQPMYLTLESFRERARAYSVPSPNPPANFLPGPVQIHPEVQRAFAEPPVSHRGAEFLTEFQETRRLLRKMAGARNVALLLGSGTLANDAVAGPGSKAGSTGTRKQGGSGRRTAKRPRGC
jgi:GNAT superfamily N-acetyltransferase